MRILIAEDDAVSRRILITQLTRWGHEVLSAQDGHEAWKLLSAADGPNLAILDWMMPKMTGVDICTKARQEVMDRPLYMILLTALNRKEYVIQGMEAGADDYLTKPFDAHELRVRLKAGERIVDLQLTLHDRVQQLEHAEQALRDMTLSDNMTGLYNHRGFYTLAEHQMKIARRSCQNSILLFADMDGLKQINDNFGHAAGSSAIVRVASVLKKTFRDCDVVARLGGDEFVVLAPNVDLEESSVLIERLAGNLAAANAEQNQPFELSLSIGTIALKHDSDTPLEEYVTCADQAMYDAKRLKREGIAGQFSAQDLPQNVNLQLVETSQS